MAISAGPAAGTNKLPGQAPLGNYENGLAVDGHEGSLFEGTLYTVTSPGTVGIYAHSGEPIGELTGFSWACGLAGTARSWV